jgi:hypothetical protein
MNQNQLTAKGKPFTSWLDPQSKDSPSTGKIEKNLKISTAAPGALSAAQIYILAERGPRKAARGKP